MGVVAVPDKRLDELAKMYEPEKYTPATIEFVDIAGLVKGASKGEGLGNKFLSNIREVDAIVHVVRCFENDIIHVDGSIDPKRDIDTINVELILSDIEILDRRIDKTQKLIKGDKKYQADLDFFKRVKEALDEGRPARSVECTPEESELLSTVSLLTNKPIIYAANLSDSDFKNGSADGNPYYDIVKKIAESENAAVLPICAEIEAEIAGMENEEKDLFLSEMGLEESGLDRLITACYDLLGLISYLTAGKQEVRAWTIVKGTKAPQAAGKIHTDFERGFIRAEVVSYDELMECGSMAAAKEKGLVRSEGKDYVMKDGDIVLFRFNV